MQQSFSCCHSGFGSHPPGCTMQSRALDRYTSAMFLIRRLGFAKTFGTSSSKGTRRKMSFVLQEIVDWFFSTTLLQDFLKDSPAAGGVTVIETCVHCCTFIGRTGGQGTYLRFPNQYEITSSWMSCLRSEMTFGSDMIITVEQHCISQTFCWVEKMPQIHW